MFEITPLAAGGGLDQPGMGDGNDQKRINRKTRAFLIETLSSLISSITDILDVDPEIREPRNGHLKDVFFDIFVSPALKVVDFVGVAPSTDLEDGQFLPQVGST